MLDIEKWWRYSRCGFEGSAFFKGAAGQNVCLGRSLTFESDARQRFRVLSSGFRVGHFAILYPLSSIVARVKGFRVGTGEDVCRLGVLCVFVVEIGFELARRPAFGCRG